MGYYMDQNTSTELFHQVRVAHRLLAAYYQRIHDLIEKVSGNKGFGLEFCSWEPTRFATPARRSTNPLNKWSWDLLPGVQTEYLFFHGDKKEHKVGDWLLAFHVVSDTGVEHEPYAKNPLEISETAEGSESVLRCYVIAPRKSFSGDWYHHVWRVIDGYPKHTDDPVAQCMHAEKEIYGCGFDVPMEALTKDGSAQVLIDRIKLYRDAAISVAID